MIRSITWVAAPSQHPEKSWKLSQWSYSPVILLPSLCWNLWWRSDDLLLLSGPCNPWKSEVHSVGWALSLGSASVKGVFRGKCQTLTTASHQPGLLGEQGTWVALQNCSRLGWGGPACIPYHSPVDYSGKSSDLWLVNPTKPYLPQSGGQGSMQGIAHITCERWALLVVSWLPDTECQCQSLPFNSFDSSSHGRLKETRNKGL